MNLSGWSHVGLLLLLLLELGLKEDFRQDQDCNLRCKSCGEN